MALLVHTAPLLFTAPLCGRGAPSRSMRPQVEALADGGIALHLPLPGLGEADVTVEVADAEGGGGVRMVRTSASAPVTRIKETPASGNGGGATGAFVGSATRFCAANPTAASSTVRADRNGTGGVMPQGAGRGLR